MLRGVALGPVLNGQGTAVSDTWAADLDLLVQAKAEAVRFEFLLGDSNAGGWTATLLSLYTTVVEQLSDKGITSIGLLGPRIVAKNAVLATTNDGKFRSDDKSWQAFLQAYVQSVATIVRRIPGITTWEVWNEPNSDD